MQQREVSKKSLASITASVVSNHNRISSSQVPSTFSHFLVPSRSPHPSNEPLGPGSAVAHTTGAGTLPSSTISNSHHQGQVEITQTATWLDRANTILSNRRFETNVDSEIKEVEKLIHEGPSIKHTLAAIPGMLQRDSNARKFPNIITSSKFNGISSDSNSVQMSSSLFSNDCSSNSINNNSSIPYEQQQQQQQQQQQSQQIYSNHSPSGFEHDKKKQRRSVSANNLPSLMTSAAPPTPAPPSAKDIRTSSGEEDAEALVSFLNSVREESYRAASTQNGHRVA